MPLHVIDCEDITKIKCDALVSVKEKPFLEKKVSKPIVNKEEIGNAKIAKADNSLQKYVVHVVIPAWRGGNFNEINQLGESYQNALELAKKYDCETIVFPLLSSGSDGYPKKQVFYITTKTISNFLQENEMTVIIGVQDRTYAINQTFAINQTLYEDISKYISKKLHNLLIDNCFYCKKVDFYDYEIDAHVSPSLKEKLSKIHDDFATTLLKFIETKGITEVECYKKANVSRQTWYKIVNEKNYKPSKITVISFAIALRLTLEETQKLLATVGYTLSESSRFDIIIEYFIEKGVYDVFTINETLFLFNEICLVV